MPQPANPTVGYTATNDAWNRIVKLVDVPTGDAVQQNTYDPRNYRTARLNYAAGILSEIRHFYYTAEWQSIEEHLGTTPDTAAPECQHVWGQRYIDDLVIRDRSTNGGVSLNERLCGLQDANWNIVALINTIAVAQERYFYSAFGWPTFFNGTMSAILSTSAVDNSILFTGQRFDGVSHLHLFRSRWYDPVCGRFLSRDQLQYNMGETSLLVASFVPDEVDPLGYHGHGTPPPLTDCQKFDVWLKKELARGTSWADALPACPCTVKFKKQCCLTVAGGWQYCDNVVVKSPNPTDFPIIDNNPNLFGNYHPGARACLRSSPTTPGGPSEQCCYGKDGKLITTMPGAGTADLSGPGGGVLGHLQDDVWPYDLALSCDGGTAGASVIKYYSVRPKSTKPCTP